MCLLHNFLIRMVIDKFIKQNKKKNEFIIQEY